MKNYFLFFLATTLFIAGCKKDDDNTTHCDDTVTPIVFVHGLLASGDTYANQMMRFTSNQYCGNRLFVFDYNSTNFTGQDLDTAGLDDFIDDILQKTGATQVNFVGHSMGGTFGYQYLSDTAHAAKVKYYAHVGSFPDTVQAGANHDFPMINIYSDADEVLTGGDIPGSINLALHGKDHYEVATCKETFVAIYKFFNNDKVPAQLEITSQINVQISGKVLTLGENTPKPNATVRVFEVNSSTGERLSSSPAFIPSINSKGEWGPNNVTPGKFYEFEVNTNDPGDRIIHYYREGFKHSNPLVYLRTLPLTGIAAILLSSLPKNDNQSVVLFTASQATISGRDSLSVDGRVLSTPTFCADTSTTIAFFLYDDGDSQTELIPLGFETIPFLEAADIFFQTVNPQSLQCRFNGRNLFVRNWKSETEGVAIAVFD